MEMKRALAAAAGTVLGFTMLATGPAFADSEHHSDRQQRTNEMTETHRCQGTRTSEQDREWLKSSIEGDHFEITGGQMAQQRNVDSMVNALGARLASDHTQSLADAVDLANKLGIEPPSTMSEKQRDELNDVSRHQGLNFGDEYSELEVQDHETDISDATKEVKQGCNPMVRDEAAKEIPMLQEHLRLSMQTSDHVEGLPGHEESGEARSSS